MRDSGGLAQVKLAEALATYAHRGQFDKSGFDYIHHPKAVFYRVFADDEFDYEGQIVAWLHDAVEDEGILLSVLAGIYGRTITEAIDAITFRNGQVSLVLDAGIVDKETRDEYYARVKANPIALRVKLHDIAHNTSLKRMEKLPPETQERLVAKYAHALESLRA